jgi:hypothetical protein
MRFAAAWMRLKKLIGALGIASALSLLSLP